MRHWAVILPCRQQIVSGQSSLPQWFLQIRFIFTGKLRPDQLQLTPEMLLKDLTKSWESPSSARPATKGCPGSVWSLGKPFKSLTPCYFSESAKQPVQPFPQIWNYFIGQEEK